MVVEVVGVPLAPVMAKVVEPVLFKRYAQLIYFYITKPWAMNDFYFKQKKMLLQMILEMEIMSE